MLLLLLEEPEERDERELLRERLPPEELREERPREAEDFLDPDDERLDEFDERRADEPELPRERDRDELAREPLDERERLRASLPRSDDRERLRASLPRFEAASRRTEVGAELRLDDRLFAVERPLSEVRSRV